jgi:hypothetical protein
MGVESLNTNDSEKVEEQIAHATKEADPTTYSMLPPEEMRVKLIRPLNEYGLPVRTGEGETYYELSDTQKHDLRGQQVIARMLKGVLPVADIITVQNDEGQEKYYSRKMPIERIARSTSPEQVAGEQLLLEYLFNSKDHLFNPHSNWANNATYKDEKLVHFDFGEDANNFLRTPTDRDALTAKLSHMTPETIAHLKEKVAELENRFSNEEGKEFFQSIIESNGAPAKEIFGHPEVFAKHADLEPTDLLHKVLVGRIAGLKKTLEQVTERG